MTKYPKIALVVAMVAVCFGFSVVAEAGVFARSGGDCGGRVVGAQAPSAKVRAKLVTRYRSVMRVSAVSATCAAAVVPTVSSPEPCPCVSPVAVQSPEVAAKSVGCECGDPCPCSNSCVCGTVVASSAVCEDCRCDKPVRAAVKNAVVQTGQAAKAVIQVPKAVVGKTLDVLTPNCPTGTCPRR